MNALDEHDYNHGCGECEIQVQEGGRDRAVLAGFDRFAATEPLEYPKVLDLALSNRCNLQCVMCNGTLSSTIRAKREGLPPLPERFGDRESFEIIEFSIHAERLQFKGGEPFLAPINRQVWDGLLENGAHPEVAVTTNGTIWTDAVEHYLHELNMDVIVSVDAVNSELLEQIRLGVKATKLWANIERFRHATKETGRSLTLSFCLMTSNWRELVPFLVQCDRIGAQPHVINVYQPLSMSLTSLPGEDLDNIVRGWSEHPQRGELGAAATALDAEVARLSERPGGAPLSNPLPTRSQSGDPMQTELAIRLLRSESPSPPVEFVLRDGYVADLRHVPSWAAELDVGRWNGRSASEIPTALSEVGFEVDQGPLQTVSAELKRVTLGLSRLQHHTVVTAWLAAGTTDSEVRVYLTEGEWPSKDSMFANLSPAGPRVQIRRGSRQHG